MTVFSFVRSAAAAVALAVALSQSAFAFDLKAYNTAAFKAAQDAGKPVLTSMHPGARPAGRRKWCSTN
jgi:hypothetical protein